MASSLEILKLSPYTLRKTINIDGRYIHRKKNINNEFSFNRFSMKKKYTRIAFFL